MIFLCPFLVQIYYLASIANWDPFAAVYNFVKIEKLKLGKIPNPLKSKEGADLEKRTRHVNLHFRVTPETSCQGLFNQIHKKATKKVPEALSCS